MDPRPFTLRQLAWMAEGKKRVLGYLAGYQASHALAAAGGGWTDPEKLNPYGEPRPEPVVSPERRARETRAAFRAMERGLFGRVVREW